MEGTRRKAEADKCSLLQLVVCGLQVFAKTITLCQLLERGLQQDRIASSAISTRWSQYSDSQTLLIPGCIPR